MRRTLSTLVLLGSLTLSSFAFASSVNWSYKGHTGPKYWGDLSKKFIMCKIGKNQSPIDINKKDLTKACLKPLKFDYTSKAKYVVNNGHTIKVTMEDGSYLYVDGKKFELKQFHFHTPSENTINGKHFPMEAHLVHISKDGEIAVIGIMFKIGKENKALKKFQNLICKTVNKKKPIKSTLTAMEFLPKNKDYYRFDGSLTTPPCTEGVRWFIFKEPVTMSMEQLKIFSKIMGKNNRPVQPVNARKVLK